MNLRDEARSILQGTDTAMRRPEETSRWFAQTSNAILAAADAAERAMGEGAKNNNEFKSTMTDARMLAALARYKAWRQLGGVSYNLYRQAGSLEAFDDAIADERKAVESWHDLVNAAGDFYIDNMWFGPRGRNFPHHWKDEMKALDIEFARLLSERKSATARADAKPVRIPDREANPRVPVVTVMDPTPAPAEPGRDLIVRVKATAPAGVKWIRLRYRHLNQKEDYQTAEMTPDAQTGLYATSIPAAFIESTLGPDVLR